MHYEIYELIKIITDESFAFVIGTSAYLNKGDILFGFWKGKTSEKKKRGARSDKSLKNEGWTKSGRKRYEKDGPIKYRYVL